MKGGDSLRPEQWAKTKGEGLLMSDNESTSENGSDNAAAGKRATDNTTTNH